MERISRRMALKLGLLAAGGYGYYRLGQGVTLQPEVDNRYTIQVDPPLKQIPKPIKSEDIASKPSHTLTEFPTIGEQIIVPDDTLTLPTGRKIPVRHRSGNTPERILSNKKDRIPGLDMDITIIEGIAYVNHGWVPTIHVLGKEIALPIVIDESEKAMKLGRPAYLFDEIVPFVASQNKEIRDPLLKLVVIAELKRGTFTPHVLTHLFDTLEAHNVAAVLFGKKVPSLRNSPAFTQVRSGVWYEG